MLQRITRLKLNIGVAAFFLLGFVPAAFAASTLTDGSDANLLDLAKPVLDAIMKGHGWIAAASALILMVATVRKLFPTNKFVQSPTGAILLVFGGAYGAATLTGLAAAGTTTLTLALAYAALKVALAAAGGFATLRPLLVDIVEPFVVKRFPWASPVFDLLTYFFDKPDAIATATAAGNAAVQAKPATGVEGVTGKATEIQ